MKVPFVDLKAQYNSIKSEIDNAISDVVSNTAFIGGSHVESFSKNFAQVIGGKYCIPVANGTDAIYIALKMLGIGAGDEVLTTASSWISTSETITQTGAKVVFVDIEKDYYTLDPQKLEEKITPKTKAIIPVHLYGQACDMDPIMEIARKHNLFVLEDCAQSHLTEYKGKIVGTIGDVSTFSFYPGKNLGAYGDAGCIITDQEDLAEKCKMYANHGALIKHQHLMEGINSRMDGIHAAILNAKLPYLKEWTDSRAKNAELYSSLLSPIDGLITPKVREESRHSYHVYCLKTKDNDRDNLIKHLNNKGVATAIHYPTSLPLLPCYQYLNYERNDILVSANHHDHILSLPMFPELNSEQIHYVSNVIKEYYA